MYHKKMLFSNIPKVDEILQNEDIQAIISKVPRSMVIESIRENIQSIRQSIIDLKDIKDFKIDEHALIQNILNTIHKKNQLHLKKVINATGVILHTNLGRALLSDSIKDQVWEIASRYSTLEFNVDTGKRGSRYSHIEDILKKLTHAESAMVVNNNAAAVLLVLDTLAKNKEAIVSRGQLVEIGGAFRVPDVMQQSGAKLVEVGTTNKTHLQDYENAISEDTGVLLKVHTSNYKILGFTQEVDLKEIVGLGNRYHIPVVEDIGSGTLIDFSEYGLYKEPTVQESILAGADIVTFSGDKLLGGPQAGIIVGKKEYIEKMKKNPYTRAFRVDKLTLSALEATLKLYLDPKKAVESIPTLKMMSMGIKEMELRANRLYKKLNINKKHFEFEKIRGFSQVGGGSMPLEKIPTILLKITSSIFSPHEIERKLRSHSVPIIARIHDESVWLDVRTIQEDEWDIIVECIQNM